MAFRYEVYTHIGEVISIITELEFWLRSDFYTTYIARGTIKR